ncbi:MAG: BON domain-containing protein [Alphaproteobacteria bacterium]
MKKWNVLTAAAFCTAVLLNCAPASAAEMLEPDNTGINQRDRSQGEVTADKQLNDAHDREVARQIRKAIMADKGLSTYAHNVKIISRDGVVTLKGPVRSSAERKTILDKALSVTGGRVMDQISVMRTKK